MPSTWNHHQNANLRAEAAASGEYDIYSTSEDDGLASREFNDSRLRRAISYLADEGGDDDPATYVDRVQQLNDQILKLYRDEGYTYDAHLYRRLRSMVHEIQNDFQQVAMEESSVDFEDSDMDLDPIVPAALYRDQSTDEEYVPPTPKKSATPAAKAGSSKQVRKPAPEVREVKYVYGGPNNLAERWHKEFPSILPFGENPFMQEWESEKINYDLAAWEKNRAKDVNPYVETNVPYESVPETYLTDKRESGSRFKLPKVGPAIANKIVEFRKHMNWAKTVDEFNRGGVAKDFVPRIFLKQVSVASAKASSYRRLSEKALGKSAEYMRSNFTDLPTGKQPIRQIGMPCTSLASESGTGIRPPGGISGTDLFTDSDESPPPSRKFGTVGPGVEKIIKNHGVGEIKTKRATPFLDQLLKEDAIRKPQSGSAKKPQPGSAQKSDSRHKFGQTSTITQMPTRGPATLSEAIGEEAFPEMPPLPDWVLKPTEIGGKRWPSAKPTTSTGRASKSPVADPEVPIKRGPGRPRKSVSLSPLHTMSPDRPTTPTNRPSKKLVTPPRGVRKTNSGGPRDDSPPTPSPKRTTRAIAKLLAEKRKRAEEDAELEAELEAELLGENAASRQMRLAGEERSFFGEGRATN
jgi:hypothetical protein